MFASGVVTFTAGTAGHVERIPVHASRVCRVCRGVAVHAAVVTVSVAGNAVHATGVTIL